MTAVVGAILGGKVRPSKLNSIRESRSE